MRGTNATPSLAVKLVTLFGRPGSGKTTLGDALAADHGFQHLPLGRMLKKAEILAEIGIDPAAMERAVVTGRTIDADLLYPWLDRQIISSRSPVVVDGYPRVASAVPHFNALAMRLAEDGAVVALHLDCPVHISEERVIARGRDDDRVVALSRRNDEFEQVQLTGRGAGSRPRRELPAARHEPGRRMPGLPAADRAGR